VLKRVFCSVAPRYPTTPRSENGLFGDQSDDPTGDADLTTGPVKKPSQPPVCPSLDISTNASYTM
jgi:hypothetical protein